MIVRRTPLKRSTKPLKRTPVRRRRTTARRGRIVDKERLTWLRTQPCIIHGRRGVPCPARCDNGMPNILTVHHVRKYGSPKDDSRGFPLCRLLHQHDFGEYSIERIGKRKFEAYYAVDIEEEILRLQRAYAFAS